VTEGRHANLERGAGCSVTELMEMLRALGAVRWDFGPHRLLQVGDPLEYGLMLPNSGNSRPS